MLPKELKKPIDDLESPSNKILVICLILAIIFLSWIYYTNAERVTSEYERKEIRQERTIDSLFQVIIYKTDVENERLRNKDRWQDSVKLILQNEIKNEIKRNK